MTVGDGSPLLPGVPPSIVARALAEPYVAPNVGTYGVGVTGTGVVSSGPETVKVTIRAFGVVLIVTDMSRYGVADQLAALLPPEVIGQPSAGSHSSFVVWESSPGRVTLAADGVEELFDVVPVVAVAWLQTGIDAALAQWSPDATFVHAGVVGWHGRAILLPGRSGAGKSTLVTALVGAGATYYSDEYAAVTADGLVNSYARRPSPRGVHDPVRDIAPPTGAALPPLRVVAVVSTRHVTGAVWDPDVTTGARSALALLDHVLMVRHEPARALSRMSAVVNGSTTFTGPRGEAEVTAGAILRRVDELVE